MKQKLMNLFRVVNKKKQEQAFNYFSKQFITTYINHKLVVNSRVRLNNSKQNITQGDKRKRDRERKAKYEDIGGRVASKVKAASE